MFSGSFPKCQPMCRCACWATTVTWASIESFYQMMYVTSLTTWTGGCYQFSSCKEVLCSALIVLGEAYRHLGSKRRFSSCVGDKLSASWPREGIMARG